AVMLTGTGVPLVGGHAEVGAGACRRDRRSWLLHVLGQLYIDKVGWQTHWCGMYWINHEMSSCKHDGCKPRICCCRLFVCNGTQEKIFSGAKDLSCRQTGRHDDSC